MSIFKRKVSEEQDRFIKKVAKKYGEPYEKVRERMDYAHKKYGVPYETFAAKDMYVLNERRWKTLAFKQKQKKEKQLEDLKKAGISPNVAAELIEDVKEKTFYEFSIDQIILHNIVFMNREEAYELARKFKRRRALISSIRKDLAKGVVSEESSGIFAMGTDAAASGAFAKDVEELYELCDETMPKQRREELAEKADDEKMLLDMDVSTKVFRTSAMEYRLYRFKGMPFANRWEFLPNALKNETLRSLPKDEDGDKFRALCDMVDNKIACYEMFKEHYMRDCIEINSKSDYSKFVEFCRKHSKFIKKPLTSSQGKDIEVFEVGACAAGGSASRTSGVSSASSADLKALFERVRTHKKVILEELVVQNEVTARFNKDSINTFRIITFNDGESVKAKWGFFRTGRAGSVVDNAGAGGVFSVIDCKTGTLCTDGADEAGNSYPVHPETGERYKGFELPKWEELEETCVELSSKFPEAAIIGWDFAYTDKEKWVIIEANCMPEFVFQGPTGVGVREEFMQLIEKRRANIYG